MADPMTKLQAAMEEDFDTEGLNAQTQITLDKPSPTPPAPEAEPPSAPSEPAPQAAPEEPKEAPQAAPATPEAPVDILAQFSKDEQDALRKFAPGGKITTPEELRVAQQKALTDYWRIQNQLGAIYRERREQEEAQAKQQPASPQQPSAPPAELQLYDTRLKELETQARGLQREYQDLENEKRDLNTKLKDLRRRRSRGDASVDAEELIGLQEALDEVSTGQSKLERQWAGLNSDYTSTQVRRKEVETILSAKTELSTLQAQLQERQDAEYTNQFYQSWEKALTAVAKQHQVPESEMADLVEAARQATFYRAHTEGALEDEQLGTFLTGVVQRYMSPIQRAKRQAEESYSKSKSGDAPKPPPQASDPKKLVAGNGKAPSPSEPKSFPEWQAELMNDPGWQAATR